MMQENNEKGVDLRARTKAYANRIIKLYTHLQGSCHFNDAAMVLAKQLIRSGTSVAANHREAKHSRSKADRINKFNIVLQELEESALWLELLLDNKMVPLEEITPLLNETNELIGIFIASLKTLHGM